MKNKYLFTVAPKFMEAGYALDRMLFVDTEALLKEEAINALEDGATGTPTGDRIAMTSEILDKMTSFSATMLPVLCIESDELLPRSYFENLVHNSTEEELLAYRHAPAD